MVALLDPDFGAPTEAGAHPAEEAPLPALRARERQQLIDALDSLGHSPRASAHVAQFVTDYPRDRRSNGYRMRLARENATPGAP